MKEAIVYSRVSKSSQSTKRQIEELSTVSGYRVVKAFNESVSGFTKSVEEREQLQKAIEFAEKHGVEVIMVHEISRLGRRTVEVLKLLNDLKEKGIKVYVKSLGLEINGDGVNEAVNKLVVTLMADLARMESEQLSYRIKSGLAARRRKGLPIGRQFGSKESADKFMDKYKKVTHYLEKGESIRWIATQMKMSPTTVQKVKNSFINA